MLCLLHTLPAPDSHCSPLMYVPSYTTVACFRLCCILYELYISCTAVPYRCSLPLPHHMPAAWGWHACAPSALSAPPETPPDPYRRCAADCPAASRSACVTCMCAVACHAPCLSVRWCCLCLTAMAEAALGGLRRTPLRIGVTLDCSSQHHCNALSCSTKCSGHPKSTERTRRG